MGGFTIINSMYCPPVFTALFSHFASHQIIKWWIYSNSLSLQVLEACMKNCGRRFHNEVAKFRFLNELVKVISPKVRDLIHPPRV